LNYILKSPATAKFKEKRSEFIAYAKPLNSRDDLNKHLKELKSIHQTARHFCWAYRQWKDEQLIENSSDAGEPSGSAGIPILNSIKSNNIINCAVIVVRFFGGVKLGKQGLVKAYRYVADLAIAKGDVIPWEPKVKVLLKSNTNFYGKIHHLIQQFNGKISNDISGVELDLSIDIKEKDVENFTIQFMEITQNSGYIKKQSEHDQTKEVRK